MRMVRHNLTLLCTAVTIFTTRFNTEKIYILPTQYIYVFCTDLRNVITSLHIIKLLVFIIETKDVHCSVRNIFMYNVN